MKALSSLTVAQLRQMAGHLDVDLVGTARKDEIVDRIRAVDAATLSSRSNADLKEALDLLGEPKSGTKAQLVARVMSAFGASAPTPAPAVTAPARHFPWCTVVRAVAAIAVVALVVWGLFAFGRYYQAQRVAAAEAEVLETVEAEVPAEVSESAEAPVPTETPEITLRTELTSTEVYSYTPGGEGFGQWATDVVTPTGATAPCGRIWQATNLENLPWTAIFCDWRTSEMEPKLQWPHATQLTVSGDGIVSFELWRDLVASKELDPDPYDVANSKDSPLGLGWFAQGFNGTVCVNGSCQELMGGGVYQIGFPSDFSYHYDVRIAIDSGQVNFWQGERLTTENNWPLPEAN